jgi:transcriptional regulator GlxA family with amidase domain
VQTGNVMTKTIALLACPGVQMLDVSGPLDVFAEANRQCGRADAYRFRVIGASSRAIESSSGVRIVPDSTIRDELESFDTVLVAGAPHITDAPTQVTMLAWLYRAALSARRYGSICSGAWMLAATGLLDGRRVTTHWNIAGQLQQNFPDVIVEPDAFYVRDGPVCTSAGITAGMDLALVLVEEDLGQKVAKAVADQLVMFFKRPGGQLQFSRQGNTQPGGRLVLQELQRWVTAHPEADHSVAALAARTGLSPRHFARVFQKEIGMTPADFVEVVRVESARRMLELGQDPPKRVASLSGYADVNGLRRAFVRRMGMTPASYRKLHRRSNEG